MGGIYGASQPRVLKVHVTAPAVGGRANEAVVAALAAAVAMRPRAVRIVAGHSSRTKVIDIVGVDPTVIDKLMAG